MADQVPVTGSHAEEVSHKSESAWRSVHVLDLMQEGLMIISHEWRYLYVNRAAAAHATYPRTELIGSTVLERFPGVEHTPMFAVLQRCMKQREPQFFETEFNFPDGSQRWFELRIEPVPEGILMLSIDISQRRELQAGVALTQKMDALSRLAGGVAHDFNNILTVIVHSSEFVSRALPADDPSQADLREILNVAERGARVVRQLQAFSRKQPGDARALQVNEALAELLPIMRRQLSEEIALEFEPDPQNPAIRIDHSHLTQVVLTLFANARDAVGASGQITISVAIEPALRTPEPRAGEHVRIAIRDNGCGMDQATLARIFEPFFTTKDPGKGTGLGLAAAHGIVKQHEGEIKVLSAPLQGTTVELYFPRVESPALVRSARSQLAKLCGGDEVILVVDDEASIRGLCSRALVKLGYTVMQCESPGEALRFVERYSGRIDLVLSDLAMPEMSGARLCQKLKAALPELRYLLMSGYVDSDHHPEVDLSQVLSKPFTQSDLARRVREVLDAEPQP